MKVSFTTCVGIVLLTLIGCSSGDKSSTPTTSSVSLVPPTTQSGGGAPNPSSGPTSPVTDADDDVVSIPGIPHASYFDLVDAKAGELALIQNLGTSSQWTEIYFVKWDGSKFNWRGRFVSALHTHANEFEYAFADYNGDGFYDLYCLKTKNTNTNSLEVHILDGRSGYSRFLLHTGTPIPLSSGHIAIEVGDTNRDYVQDIIVMRDDPARQPRVEVEHLSGATTFQTQQYFRRTILSTNVGDNYQLLHSGDINYDWVTDLFAIKKNNTASGNVEAHVLSGAHNYEAWILNKRLPKAMTADDTQDYVLIDFDGDRVQDLVVLNKSAGGLTIDVISGASGLASFIIKDVAFQPSL
ncbi:MAG: VCBS repeat-containing protein [Deltaproteobacteria bacterium]|nr:VCBS repeat-containing protein [Deltaproteobacteria bacterium]